ncbi:MAG: hypothetical protein ACREJB_15000 [Planctomycetaceae bacterium]
MTPFEKLSQLLVRLQEAKIHHTMRDTRNNAISIDVAVPGQRWEIDVLEDGSVEVETFQSNGTIHDESKLEELFDQFSD